MKKATDRMSETKEERRKKVNILRTNNIFREKLVC